MAVFEFNQVILPTLLLFFGYSTTIFLFRDRVSLIEKWFLSLIIGYSLITLPNLITGLFTENLTHSLRYSSLAVSFISVLFLLLSSSYVRQDLVALRRLIHKVINNESLLPKLAFVAVIFFAAKVFLLLTFEPFNGSDALSYWIPVGKSFYTMNEIPLFNPYVFKYTYLEPLLSLLFAWAFALSGSVNSEAFRLLPFPFMMALPFLAYLFTKYFTQSERYKDLPIIALFISIVLPITDYILYFYALYPDIFALVFCLSSLFLFKKALHNRSSRLFIISALAFALTLLTKYWFGIAALLLIASYLALSIRTQKQVQLPTVMLLGVLIIPVFAFAFNFQYTIVAGSIVGFAIVVGMIVIISNYTNKSYEPLPNKINLLSFILPSLIPLVWGVRNLVNGLPIFGVGRLKPLSDAEVQYHEVFRAVQPPSLDFSSFFAYIWHPWLNIYGLILLGVGLLFSFRDKSLRQVLLLFLMTYLLYLTLTSAGLSGRHLLIMYCFIAAILGIGAINLSRITKFSGEKILLGTLISIAIFSQFQYATFSFWLENIGSRDVGIFSELLRQISIAYAQDFSPSTLFDKALPFLVINLATGISFAILYKIYGHKLRYQFLSEFSKKMILTSSFLHIYQPINKKSMSSFRKKVIPIILLILIMGAINLPMYRYMYATTDGHMELFSDKASWRTDESNVAKVLKKLINQEDVVLTYRNRMVAYEGIRVMDLYEGGGIGLIIPLLNDGNLTNVQSHLKSAGIKYILIPSEKSPWYKEFQTIYGSKELFRSIQHEEPNSVTNLILDTKYWKLYQLTIG